MYAYKGEAFISKQKNGYKILNKIVVIPWNSCTVMYMYEENLLLFSHVQTFEQNVHVQAFEAKIVCCTNNNNKNSYLLIHTTLWIRNQNFSLPNVSHTMTTPSFSISTFMLILFKLTILGIDVIESNTKTW